MHLALMSLLPSLIWNGHTAFLCLLWRWHFWMMQSFICLSVCLPVTPHLGLSAASSWLDSGSLFQPENYINNDVSFSGYLMWRHIANVNFDHSVRVLSDFSTVELVVFFFFPSYECNKQSVGQHFKIVQISCSSSEFPPRCSICWWFLPGTVFSIKVANCWLSNSSPASSQHQRSAVSKNHSDWLIDGFTYSFSRLSLVWAHGYLFFSVVCNSLLNYFDAQIVQVWLVEVHGILP